MMMPALKLRFWGVRGSIPTPLRQNLGYGGNTPCLEVRDSSENIFIFDGGTGLRLLGNELKEEFGPQGIKANIFLSHFHWDHIQGIPFFAPFYQTGNEFTFYYLDCDFNLQQVLAGQMTFPYFPVDITHLPSTRKLIEIPKEGVQVGAVLVKPIHLNHPQGCLGFKIESGSKIAVYLTDHEHGSQAIDDDIRRFVAKADVLIYDSNYTPEDYLTHKGWGHSTWAEGVHVAKDAGVKQLVLFHYDPSYEDTKIDEILANARREFPETAAAREGDQIAL